MARDIEEMQRQLHEVQSQLAFQEDVVGALDAALASQQRDILELRRQVALLNERCRALLDGGAGPGEPAAPVHEKPPHY